MRVVAKNLGREKKQNSATKSNLRKEGLFQKALSRLERSQTFSNGQTHAHHSANFFSIAREEKDTP